MNVLFATGSDSAFFNSLLVCLQAFAERMPDCRLFVCDFGLTDAQSQFLRGLGQLLDRPPALRSSGPFRCKAALLRYLLHNGKKVEDYDAVVWLDADLTLMGVGKIDFQAVIDDMSLARAEVALCHAGINVSQVISLFGESSRMLPFARSVADAAIDGSLPYFSTGLFFCRSAAVLSRWDELTESVIDHPLLDQNVFNVVLHRDAVPSIVLDLEEWQAQGESLDRVQLIVSGNNVRPTARIAEKNLKALHTTSPASGHLLIGQCRFTVRDVDLTGSFKLFLAEPLRLHQLQLLSSFILDHGEALLRLGLCSQAARPVDGFLFETL